MTQRSSEELPFFEDTEQMTQAMRKAVQDALRRHKLLGQPIVTWRDGKVVWVPAEEIELDEDCNGTNGHAKPQ